MNISSITPQQKMPRDAGTAIERARVVWVQRGKGSDDSTVWVEAFQRSTCGACNARDACGQGVLQRWFARRQRHYPVRCAASQAGLLSVGQWVEIAVPEGALSRAALLAYLLPLAGMLLAAILAEQIGLADLLVALCGGFGLYAGVLCSRRLALPRRGAAELEPRLLRLASS
ncbi:MAG: SoxR reducing system RseC family protein [Pseudomonadales bacterium]